MRDKASVTILHLPEDAESATTLADRLVHRGYGAWCLEQVQVGDSIERELDARIRASGAVLVYGSALAAGTLFIRRTCEAIRNLAKQEGSVRLIIGRMEPTADVDLLHPGSKVAHFAVDYERALDQVCTALGAPWHAALTCSEIAQRFKAGNSVRIAAYVGDKYRPNLYVSRDLERQIRAFVSDPRTLLDSCAEQLEVALNSSVPDSHRARARSWNIKPLGAAERRTAQVTLDSCRNGSVLSDQATIEELAACLLPATYMDIEAELACYRECILENPSNLSIHRVYAVFKKLEELLHQAKADAEVLLALRNTLATLTERYSSAKRPKTESRRRQDVLRPDWIVDKNSGERIAMRALSGTSSSTRESETFATVRHRLDMLSRAVTEWSRSRVLAARVAKAEVGRGPGHVDLVTVDDVVSRCEALVDAVRRRCLLIVDVAGSGKTNMLSALSEKHALGAPTVALFVKGFEEGGNVIEDALNESVRADLGPGFDEPAFDTLLARTRDELDQLQSCVLVMIDGINEFSNDAALAESLRATVAKYHDHRVRFVVTCRDIYWRYFKDTLSGPSYKLNVGGLRRYSDSEFKLAVSKYLKEYGLDHVRIEEGARDAFRSPILLRFFCEAYGSHNGRPSSSAPSRVSAVNLKRLFDDYMKAKLQKLVETGHAKIRYRPLKEERTMAELMLRIAAKIRQAKRPHLSRKEASEAMGGEDMDSRASAYGLLLDEDVILEERNGRVFFVYEAFLEYAIARAALRDSNAQHPREILDRMVDEAVEFRNMRGAALMALVILVEEQRVGLSSYLLSKGDEWRAIVLSAVAQIPTSRMDDDSMGALAEISRSGTSEERKESIRILLTHCGQAGRRVALGFLRGRSHRQRSELTDVLSSVGDAQLVRDLVEDCESGNSFAESALLVVHPGRRVMGFLEDCMRTKKHAVLVTILRMLGNAKPGELKRALKLADQHVRDPRMAVAAAAQSCQQMLRTRLKVSEGIRRGRISSARRRAMRQDKNAD